MMVMYHDIAIINHYGRRLEISNAPVVMKDSKKIIIKTKEITEI